MSREGKGTGKVNIKLPKRFARSDKGLLTIIFINQSNLLLLLQSTAYLIF